jgi:hypothetical protein
LGISSYTVRRALQNDAEPVYSRKKRINKDIELFTELIKESSLVRRYKVSRILNDIQSKEYKGSKSSLYRYIETQLKSQGEREQKGL